jgi:hypothetical protein
MIVRINCEFQAWFTVPLFEAHQGINIGDLWYMIHKHCLATHMIGSNSGRTKWGGKESQD